MSSVPLLDLQRQYESLRGETEAVVREVIESQRFVLGEPVECLEREIADYVGTARAVGCASGTDALILSLAALGVGPGDEVVTTPFSFFATASCAYKVGARPVFVDIDPQTFNLDPNRLADALTGRTRAVIPVHLFGQCAEMGPVLDLARERGIAVIEDAAQALGASYRSADGAQRKAGAMGACGAYSFFPTKNLGGFGDGGMIVTDDEELADLLRSLRVHGELRRYEHRHVGWNSRLDALQAAVLRIKLPHLDDWSRARAENAARYERGLTEAGLVESGDVRLPGRCARSSHIFNQFTLRVKRRDALIDHLREHGIGHAVYYPIPLHLQACFTDLGYGPGRFPEAEAAAAEVVSLPIFPELTGHEQRRVLDVIRAFYAG